MAKAEEGIKRSNMLALKAELFDSMIQDQPLDILLGSLCSLAEQQVTSSRVAIVSASATSGNLDVHAAPNLTSTLRKKLHQPGALDWLATGSQRQASPCWSFPFPLGENVTSFLLVFADKTTQLAQQQKEHLATLSRLAALAIANAKQEELLGHYQLAFENSTQGILVADSKGKVFRCNRAWLECSGWEEDESCGLGLLELIVGDQPIASDLEEALRKNKTWRGEIECQRKQGDRFAALCSISCVLDQAKNVLQYVAEISDISIVKASEQRLKYLAHHDALTDLPNRATFAQSLEHSLLRQLREKQPLAVLFVDLDDFKRVNDQEGHAVGDLLLKQVAKRLQNCVRDTDMVARFGGDEFTLMVNYKEINSIEMLADRITRELSAPFVLNGHEHQISASIGIALAPEDSMDGATLLQNADAAMYQAKSLGKHRYCFFSWEINRAIKTRKEMEVAVRHAVRNGELDLAYQPKFDRNGKVVGIEALLRWNNKAFKDVGVPEFIKTAERIRVIDSIGEWIMTEGCKQIKSWQNNGHQVKLSFNISRYQLQRELQPLIERIVREAGISPSDLEIEINESTLLEEVDSFHTLLSDISRMGVTVALDDFGAGYSSLSNLNNLPVDKLKVDQTLIAEMARSQGHSSVVSAAIALGRALNITVAAEGIETKEQHKFLMDSGCEEFQGYFLGRPVTSEELGKLLH